MNIGILETGSPPTPLDEGFGSYGDMFRRLLGPAFRFTMFDVRNGDLPPSPRTCEAYLITGSASGVYDGDPWIAALEAFVRGLDGDVKILGVCFGHQLLAQAFGGRVEKSAKGWGLGLQTYAVTNRPYWMDEVETFSLPASHRDQVVEPPPQSVVLAASDFTPYAALAYPGRLAASFQAHPEFSPDYAAALIESRRGRSIDEAQAAAATASQAQPNDSQRVAIWLRRFLGG